MTRDKEDMRALRKRIDDIDEELVRLLNERASAAEAIGKIKMRLGLEVYSPEREQEVIRLVKEANPGPLSDAAVSRLFERIIDESRSVERIAVETSVKKNGEA